MGGWTCRYRGLSQIAVELQARRLSVCLGQTGTDHGVCNLALHVAHKRRLAIGLVATVTVAVALSCNVMPAHAMTLEDLQQQVQESSQHTTRQTDA